MASAVADRSARPAGGGEVFDRLAGLETEYALRFHPDAPPARDGPDGAATGRPPATALFDALVAQLRRAMPLATGLGKKGFFLANGGAVWHEVRHLGHDVALVEGSTPECRGPRQLIAHQRAQDALLAAAARDTSAGGEMALCKSDRDALGNTYGAQENYELTLATGWRLWAWRVGVALILPTVVLGWLSVVLIAVLFLLSLLVAPIVNGLALLACAGLAACRVPFARRVVEDERVRDRLTAWICGGGLDRPPPAVNALAYLLVQLMTAPSAWAMSLLADALAFRRARRQLLPLLVTRAVVCGSGRLADDGSFHVAAKATGLHAVTTPHELFHRRPVFTWGHFMKALYVPWAYRSPWRPRQRLQIGLGDSNLCEEAEYLRVGTTMLVLDVIEAGEMPPAPRLRRPMRALRAIATDPTLRAQVALRGGRRATALEIQWFYLRACEQFLSRRPHAPADARDVLRRWADVLERLETDPQSLVGRLDWVSKKFLLDRCAADAPWEVRKKIDLRYHELSPDGYFRQLCSAGVVKQVVAESEVDAARQDPPADSPAAERGRQIRRHAGSDRLKVSWERVTLGPR